MPDATNGMSTMSEWADIDIFVVGLAIGLVIGGMFSYWAIRAFMTGVRQGFDKRVREDDQRERERLDEIEKGYQPTGDAGPKRPPTGGSSKR